MERRDGCITNKSKGLWQPRCGPVVLYRCETGTLMVADKCLLTAFEMTAFRTILRVSWVEYRTNVSFLEELQPKQRLMLVVQSLKLKCYRCIDLAQNLTAWSHRWQKILWKTKTMLDWRYQGMDGCSNGRMCQDSTRQTLVEKAGQVTNNPKPSAPSGMIMDHNDDDDNLRVKKDKYEMVLTCCMWRL